MAQANHTARAVWSRKTIWAVAGIAIAAVAVAAFSFQGSWLPAVKSLLAQAAPPPRSESANSEPPDEHAGHDHAGHDDVNSIEISEQARKNIGLQMEKVALSNFTRTVSIPGIVVERPGKSLFQITTSLTGIVTEVFASEGEAVSPGQPLFELRLTHEEIVQAQADLLRTAEELQVVGREVERLEKVTAEGAIAGKTMLERQYEKQKLDAVHRAQKQALLLHGLTANQIEDIVQQKRLLQKITVSAPTVMRDSDETKPVKFQIQSIQVVTGQQVNAGEPLAVLVDYSTLLIEGNAFEADAKWIEDATRQKVPVQAIVEREGVVEERVDGLPILYQGSRVDAESRATHFYVSLRNTVHEEREAGANRTFLSWKYRPGQRMRLQVPVEILTEKIVVPVTAVAQDGVESYVFAANGKHFDRRPVHVEFRDDFTAVIANDGSLFVGDEIATNGAQQLQLALKNKAGGGIDPHAGHNH